MIETRELQYTYAGADGPTLRGLDFTVERGEVFGFLGPSGAGKSTTQKVLTGLLDDYTGEVTVLDRSVRDWGSDLYERIGIATETPTLYRKLTGRENLELRHSRAVRLVDWYRSKVRRPSGVKRESPMATPVNTARFL